MTLFFFRFHEPPLPTPTLVRTPSKLSELPALENLIEEAARAFRLEFSPAPAVPWQVLNRKPMSAAREHSTGEF